MEKAVFLSHLEVYLDHYCNKQNLIKVNCSLAFHSKISDILCYKNASYINRTLTLHFN